MQQSIHHAREVAEALRHLITEELIMDMKLYHKPNQIIQVAIGELAITWNPDDNRYYVQNLTTHKTFASHKYWHNATAAFRKLFNTRLNGDK